MQVENLGAGSSFLDAFSITSVLLEERNPHLPFFKLKKTRGIKH